MQTVRGGDGKVAFLVTGLVTEVWVFLSTCIPAALYRIYVVVTFVLVLIETNVVKNKEFGLGPEVGDVGDTRALQKIGGLAGNVAWITAVILTRNPPV